MTDENFLSRWSRRKSEARTATPSPQKEPAPPAPVPAPAAPVPESAAPQPLPPVESLTPESDFVPFMKGDVDAALKRQALKTLFQDPRFNVMDGLDVYIDDYSKPDPLPAGWLEKMAQTARLGEYREPDPQAQAGRGEAGEIPRESDHGEAQESPTESDCGEARENPAESDRGEAQESPRGADKSRNEHPAIEAPSAGAGIPEDKGPPRPI
jgi:hypothetical protein